MAKSLLLQFLANKLRWDEHFSLLAEYQERVWATCLYVLQAEQMERSNTKNWSFSSDQWRKGKKSTFRHAGDAHHSPGDLIHPSHPRSSQGTESGKDSLERRMGWAAWAPAISSWKRMSWARTSWVGVRVWCMPPWSTAQTFPIHLWNLTTLRLLMFYTRPPLTFPFILLCASLNHCVAP